MAKTGGRILKTAARLLRWKGFDGVSTTGVVTAARLAAVRPKDDPNGTAG